MGYKFVDRYSKKAQAEGYKARSAYKLLEIQEKHKLINKGDRVLDLGCAPGSWSQAASQMIGGRGVLFGIDLLPVNLKLANGEFRVGDVFEITAEEFPGGKMNVLISDMAPKTTGVRLQDQSRSLELCHRVLDLCEEMLVPGGHVVMKLFMGPDQNEVIQRLKKSFKKFHQTRPDSTRKESKEIFLVGLDYNGETEPRI